MGTEFLVGVLIGLLAASVFANLTVWYLWHGRDRVWKDRLVASEDARHAAELRSGEQIDAMLERISTSPRIEIRPPAVPTIDPEERHDFTDFDEDPTSQAAWNEYRGEPEDES